MIATIAETIRAYRNQDRRHETIAPFLPVQMRTDRTVKSQRRDQSWSQPGLNRCHLEYVAPYGKSWLRHRYRRKLLPL